MGQQSKPGEGLGTAHPVPYSPQNTEKPIEKEEKEIDYNSLEEALTT